MSVLAAQLQPFILYGSGATIGDQSITLASFNDIDGNQLTMATFGTKGYGTAEPGAGLQEEQVSFTGVTPNVNGTVTLTGVKTVGFLTPYTETAGLAKSHAGGVRFVISNTAAFYDSFLNASNNETVTGAYTFTDPNVPRLNTAHAYAGGEEEYLATKRYVDSVALAGAPDASTTTKGVTKLTTAPLSPTNPIAVGATDVATTGASVVIRSKANSKLDDALLGLTTAGDLVYSDGTDLQRLPLGATGQSLRASGLAPAWVSLSGSYGDGSDGAVSISSPTTLTRDMFYSSLTVSAVVTTAGYRVFVRDVLTVSTGGQFKNAGGAGGAGGNGVSATPTGGTAGSAGAVAPGGSLPAGKAGKVGVVGVSNNASVSQTSGNAGVVGDTVTSVVGSSGASGGVGGGGISGGLGGAVGTGGGFTQVADMPRYITRALTFSGANPSAGSGSGGSGGVAGGTGNNDKLASGGSGGSGGTGGFTLISAASIVLSGSGDWIDVSGGIGGLGGNGARTTNNGGSTVAGGGGGGGGGVGGVSILIYSVKSGTMTTKVAGGAGGTGGTSTENPGWGLVQGGNGATGASGLSIELVA